MKVQITNQSVHFKKSYSFKESQRLSDKFIIREAEHFEIVALLIERTLRTIERITEKDFIVNTIELITDKEREKYIIKVIFSVDEHWLIPFEINSKSGQ